MKILLVEDDNAIMETMVDFLGFHGHIVECAYNGLAALEFTKNQSFDVIVMDVMMPRLNGIDTVHQLREQDLIDTPILFLTARDSIEDKKKAYQAGGDDYLVKPFALDELMLRIEALARRGYSANKKQLIQGDLIIDIEKSVVSYANNPVKLSNIQFKILKHLMQKYPAMVTRQALIESVWGEECPESDSFRSHLYALRKTLQKLSSTLTVETVHGRGIRLVC